jgi:hypothetical protein
MGTGSGPEAAFAGAAEHFFELLKSFAPPPGIGTGKGQAGADPAALAASLAGQFEQWLRATQSAASWFASPGGATAATAAFAPGARPWPFAPLPVGMGAAGNAEGQRTWELMMELAQLQTQLAAHWHQIATSASQQFLARLGAAATERRTLEGALKLYELWVDCAEEAYAATVHKDDFAQLQSRLANVGAALLVEQRRHAESLARAFGLPTRNEIDALQAQLKELRLQLAQLMGAPGDDEVGTARAGRKAEPRRPAATGAAKARKRGGSAPRRRGARRPRGRRA